MIRAILACLLVLSLAADAEAAQLAISVAGGVIGSFFGPLGFAIGWTIGSLIGGLLFPPKGPPTQHGPRLADKTVQSSSFGSPIAKLWGMDRLKAEVIFSSKLKETAHKTEMGKMGGSSQTSVTYTYAVDLMLSFGRKAKGVKRIWADTKLIYDASGAELKKKWSRQGKRFTLRDGNESQLPSALEESYHGVGLCSAHRGLFCLEAADFQLKHFANRVPNFTAEVFTEGSSDFSYIDSYVPPPPPYSFWLSSWGYVDDNGEIWAMYYPASTRYPYPPYAHIFHWTLDKPDDPVEEAHSLWSGDPEVTQGASVSGNIRVRSDEPSAAAFGTNDLGVVSYFRLESGGRIDLGIIAGAMQAVEVLVKYGADLYTLNGHSLYFGPDNGTVNRFGEEGGLLAQSPSFFGGIDMVRSESYLWILSSAEFIWKVDPEDLSIITTIDVSSIDGNILAIYAVSDSDLRVFSAGSGGSQFHKIINDGAPVLDVESPDQTYSGIRGFRRFGLRYAGGMYIVDFAGYIGGFGALIDFFGPTIETLDIPLWKIVRDTNIMSGLDSVIEASPPVVGDIAVGELTDWVHGYTLTRAMTYREALYQLALVYFFDCREKDLKLDYPKRGKPPVALLPNGDLAARSALTEELPDVLTRTRERETEAPLRVHVIYNNWEFSYQPGHEYAPRQITDATATETLEVAVAITSTKAQEVADVNLATRWLGRETFQLKTSRRYLQIDAADNIEVEITEVGDEAPSLVQPVGIASGQAFGTLALSGPAILTASAIASAEVFGTLQLGEAATLTASAIASAEAFGTLKASGALVPSSIATGQAFGTTSVSAAGAEAAFQDDAFQDDTFQD